MVKRIFVVGAGTMGAGIAQLAAQKGFETWLYDVSEDQRSKAQAGIHKSLATLVEKGKMDEPEKQGITARLHFVQSLDEARLADLVIEAIVENLGIKHQVFQSLEQVVSPHCILASNTSSLSIASISSALTSPARFLGIHFFNPATLMPLVEVIPSVLTSPEVVLQAEEIIAVMGKTVAVCKDTPGFIVNRVARPFYGEALRMYEEGIADFATIDYAMTSMGGFKMGPFELMDYIGNDVNYTVTETVFEAFYFDPRFKPSFTQKRLKEAGLFGRKTGRGFYDYATDRPEPKRDEALLQQIFNRIIAMLINEAYDAVLMQVASPNDIDLAMMKGVNYPKGLLAWSEELGPDKVLQQLMALQERYGEDRYRPNALLTDRVSSGKPLV
ncbi:MAG: 3-hydroxybutyryl-CoA dehydrogenase [Flavobacteriia bacterium]|nr:3-hydroxybutyryl-CoA dehydrogenase [Flavobacteriia bacterium]